MPLAHNKCVDVARQYMLDVHGVNNIESVNGAKDFFLQSYRPKQDKYYFRIAYQKGIVPSIGTIIIWNGNFGHIAIVDESDQYGFTVLEQDGYNNATKDVSKGDSHGLKQKNYNYHNVLGWLVLKQDRLHSDQLPKNAVIAKSDREAQIGWYWFNEKTGNWMILTNAGWINV